MEFPQFKETFNKPGIELLPHRPPFLFVDELVSADETGSLGKYTYTEEKNDFFKGHFPGHPIMPGVLILEAMAQVGGVAMLYPEEHRGKIALFGGMEHVKFKHPVIPGDQLVTKAEIVRVRGNFGVLHADGYVKDKLVASADFKFALKEQDDM